MVHKKETETFDDGDSGKKRQRSILDWPVPIAIIVCTFATVTFMYSTSQFGIWITGLVYVCMALAIVFFFRYLSRPFTSLSRTHELVILGIVCVFAWWIMGPANQILFRSTLHLPFEVYPFGLTDTSGAVIIDMGSLLWIFGIIGAIGLLLAIRKHRLGESLF